MFGRPRTDRSSSPPGTLHDLNGGRTRLLVPPGPRSPRVPSGDSTYFRRIKWRDRGLLTFTPPPRWKFFNFLLGLFVVAPAFWDLGVSPWVVSGVFCFL